MASNIRESDLPGIGRKFQVETRSGDKLVIVIHDDGTRELYHFYYDNPDDSISMISLSDSEARQIAGIIGGLSYQPKALESMEMNLNELVIEWVKIPHSSAVAGKTIADLGVREQTGATIIAVIDGDAQLVNPGPSQVLMDGAMLVVVGNREQVKKFKRLVTGSA